MTTAEQFEGLLPRVMRAGVAATGPMAGLIDSMAALMGPRAEMISAGRSLFDPMTAPEAMLPFLAHWLGRGALFRDPMDPRRSLGLDDGFPPGVERLRLFLAAVPMLDDLRGSTDGLRAVLRIATGHTDLTVHDNLLACHVTVAAPAGLIPVTSWLSRVIAAERPAHMTWSLSFTAGGDAA